MRCYDDMLGCILSESTQQKLMGLLYMTASESLFNMFVLLHRRKGLNLFQLRTNLISQDTRNSKIKINRLSLKVYMNTCEKLGNRIFLHEPNSESLLQGYFVGSLRFGGLLKALPVPIVTMTLHPVYSENKECTFLTITVLIGNECLLPYCVVATAFAPQVCPFIGFLFSGASPI